MEKYEVTINGDYEGEMSRNELIDVLFEMNLDDEVLVTRID